MINLKLKQTQIRWFQVRTKLCSKLILVYCFIATPDEMYKKKCLQHLKCRLCQVYFTTTQKLNAVFPGNSRKRIDTDMLSKYIWQGSIRIKVNIVGVCTLCHLSPVARVKKLFDDAWVCSQMGKMLWMMMHHVAHWSQSKTCNLNVIK